MPKIRVFVSAMPSIMQGRHLIRVCYAFVHARAASYLCLLCLPACKGGIWYVFAMPSCMQGRHLIQIAIVLPEARQKNSAKHLSVIEGLKCNWSIQQQQFPLVDNHRFFLFAYVWFRHSYLTRLFGKKRKVKCSTSIEHRTR